MEQYLFHTNLQIPILSLINGLVLLSGFYFFGQIIITKTILKKVLERYSFIDYQNILITVIIISFFFYPLILFIKNSLVLLKITTYLLYLFGAYSIILNSKTFFEKLKVNININKINFKNQNIEIIILFFLITGYFLISIAPVTNADSLDYHLYTGKYILNYSGYPKFLTNFHSTRLSGSGEIFISMGLLVGSEQFSSVLQFSGIISLIGIFRKLNFSKINFILLLSAPVIIFFSSSLKPQFFQICASGFVFLIIIKELYNKKVNKNLDTIILLLCSTILFLNTQVKFSFFLSAYLLSFLLIFLSFKKKIFIKFILINLILYFLIIFPPLIWKFNNFGGNFFELLYSPFTTNLYGLEYFKSYLTNLNKGNFVWIIVPQHYRELTQSLGIGCLIFIYLIFKSNNKTDFLILFTIILFLLITYFYGQNTARFFLEPYIWTILYFSLKFINIKFYKLFKFAIYSQSLIILCMISYGVIFLSPGVLSKDLREKVLSNHANGYLFFKWSKNELEKLGYNGTIISSKRSIGFLENITIPPEHLYFTDLKKPEAYLYVQEIKKLKPKYIIYSKETDLFKIYENCFIKKVSDGKKIDKHAVRNPFLKSNNFNDIEIYEFDYKKLPFCISDKKSAYSK